MPVSGTVPFFDYSTAPNAGGDVVAQVSGGGLVSGAVTHATENLVAFLRRANGVLGAVSGVTSGGADLLNLQHELAMRISDLEKPGNENAARLAHANAVLTAAGELSVS